MKKKTICIRVKTCNVILKDFSTGDRILNTVDRIMKNYLDYSWDPHGTIFYMHIIQLHYIYIFVHHLNNS
jgi:hypothetical protein